MDGLSGNKSVFEETAASSWLMTLFANDEYAGRRQEYNRMKNWFEHFRSSNDNLSCEGTLVVSTRVRTSNLAFSFLDKVNAPSHSNTFAKG